MLHEEAGSSDNTFQNGWMRDRDPETGKVLESRQIDDPSAPGGKRGMRFADFMALPIVGFCQLTEAEVFALRFYTTAGYKGINWPLRDQTRRSQNQPHRLAVLVFVLAGAIKKLRAWAANAGGAQRRVDLFRGMSNRKIFDEFMTAGGTELAPMSTTAELRVALQSARVHRGRQTPSTPCCGCARRISWTGGWTWLGFQPFRTRKNICIRHSPTSSRSTRNL